MLEVDNVDACYGDLQALWGVSLKVEKGEVVALIGSNGAGKSTLLRTISGVMRPKSGRIMLEGVRLDGTEKHRIVELGVALVPEGRRLFPDMTVFENLEMGAFVHRARKQKDETLEWIFTAFPILGKRVNQAAGTLSGGEQQMLAIARGMMSRPKLLLLDEVSLGLAPLIVKSIYEIIIKVSTSSMMTILIVEQNVRYALQTARRAYIIENGRIVGHGDSQDLMNRDEVKRAYLAIG
jgi:branched-chain amino acid transport system ATP-binding protein